MPPRSTAADLCLFAHFDRDGMVDAYVHRYLHALRGCGFDVVFVTASRLAEADRVAVARICVDVIERPNRGHDFGSWADAFARHRDRIAGRLLLANDSVYGPIGSLKNALAALTAQAADFYGFVENRSPRRHLQSWFVLMENHVARSETFRDLMATRFEGLDKPQVILRGEVALSSSLLAAGYRLRSRTDLGADGFFGDESPAQPMHMFWREMIEREGVPFVKIDLLRDNAMQLHDLADLDRILGERAPDLAPLIATHRARIGSHAGPTARGTGARLHSWVRQRQYRMMRAGRQWQANLLGGTFFAALRLYRVLARRLRA